MSKVIQNIKLELHRGLEGNTSDPYLYRSNQKEKGSKPYWTLGTIISHSRCSRTFIRNAHNVRIFGSASAILLLVILSLTVMPVSVKTDEAEAANGVSTTSSTTITVNNATAKINLTTASADGTFAKSEGGNVASFGVKTTNYTGYTLTVKASDNDGTLTNTSGTGTFTSIDEVIYEETFDNAIYNGKWGYRPSKYNGVNNNFYRPSPTTTATTLDITNSPNSTDNTYTIALGARAAYTQPTGIYSKTVILTATANQAAYSITYTDNTTDASVKNLPDITNGGTTDTSIKLSTVTPSRNGYTFAGWCTVAPTNSGTSCSGTTFQPGDNFGLDQTTENIITLYATWTARNLTINFAGSGVSSVQVRTAAGTGGTLVGTVSTSGGTVSGLVVGQSYYLYPTFTGPAYAFASWAETGSNGYLSCSLSNTCTTDDNPVYIAGDGNGAVTITGKAVTLGSCASADSCIQYYTKSMCEANATDAPVTLTDARDGHTYRVRYIQGNCWMVDNLIFGYNEDNPNSYVLTLDSELSNVPEFYTANMPLNLPVFDMENNYSASGGYCHVELDKTAEPYTFTADSGGQTYSCIHTGTINAADAPYSETDLPTVWYNYALAMAGTITGSRNNGMSGYDICPAGWGIPDDKEWKTIGGTYSNPNSTYAEAFSMVYGGYRGKDGLTHIDIEARFAAAKAYPENSPSPYKYVSMSEAGARLGGVYLDSNHRGPGIYVRCIAK